jgi:hypothetical protein
VEKVKELDVQNANKTNLAKKVKNKIWKTKTNCSRLNSVPFKTRLLVRETLRRQKSKLNTSSIVSTLFYFLELKPIYFFNSTSINASNNNKTIPVTWVLSLFK